MAEFTWIFDAPTGVFKNHALSAQLYRAAVENSVLMDHVSPIDAFGKRKGETVTWTRIASIAEATDPVLSETERIPEDTYALSTGSATVQEIGRSIPVTEFARNLTHFDLLNSVQQELREQMRLSLDTLAAAAFKRTKIKYVQTGAASRTITTNGTPGAAATANMNIFHCEEIRDYLFDTQLVPTLEDETYVGVFRTLGLRGIKRDADWEEWKKYTDPSAKFNSEVGKIEGIRFIETNHNLAFGKIGTGSVLGEGIVFGRDSVKLAEAMTPELRAALPEDYGRSQGVAWYGVLRMEPIWATGNAGQDRILHVSST